MKKIFFVLLISIVMVGCGTKEESKDLPKEITDISWERDITVDTEVIYFGSEKDFHYYERVGNPVGNYDLCETYKYDGEKIKLNCSEKGMIDEIEIVSYDENTLVLKFDKEERTFTKTLEVEE